MWCDLASAVFIGSPDNGAFPGVLKTYSFIDGLVFHTFSARKLAVLESLIQKSLSHGKIRLMWCEVNDAEKLQTYIPKKIFLIFYRS